MPFSKFAYRKSGETRISVRSQGSALSNSVLLSHTLSPRGRKKFVYRLRKHDVNLAAAAAAVLRVSARRSSVWICGLVMVLVRTRETDDFLRPSVTRERAGGRDARFLEVRQSTFKHCAASRLNG